VLKPGGKFVAKIFRGKNVDLLYSQLKILFQNVIVAKPRSSRASSVEAFIVCLNFMPPKGFQANLERPIGVGTRLPRMALDRLCGMPIFAKTTMQNPDDTSWSWVPATSAAEDDGFTELEVEDLASGQSTRSAAWIAPFIACGDLSAFDSDASYKLPADHVSLDPIQPPVAPPYKVAIELRKTAGGAYGKTSKP
jgi:tRNA (cytidine32/guanosine34-2'-O)-methyltransferase